MWESHFVKVKLQNNYENYNIQFYVKTIAKKNYDSITFSVPAVYAAALVTWTGGTNLLGDGER